MPSLHHNIRTIFLPNKEHYVFKYVRTNCANLKVNNRVLGFPDLEDNFVIRRTSFSDLVI